MNTRVDLHGVCKHYGSTVAVDDLSLTVAAGQITALLGPSGSGKTSILKMIAGLLEPSAGDVCFGGESVLGVPAPRRDAATVFHNALLFPYLSVWENVAFGLRMRKVPAEECRRRAGEMLELVGLAGMGTRRPHEISGGQQQRVALARALVVEPRVLLLDEPLANLDRDLRGGMRDLLRSIHRRIGLTVLLVTHDQEDAVVVADHVALIRNGRLVQEGGVEDFFTRPASAWVAGFFGACNFIPGDLREGVLQTSLGALTVGGGTAGPGRVQATIRPEAVRLGGPAGSNTFTGRVLAAEFRGTHGRVRVEVDGVEVEAVVSPDEVTSHAAGSSVRVTFPAERLWVVAAE